MKNKNPEIPHLEKVNLMSFLEGQASDLDEVEKREQYEAKLKTLNEDEEKAKVSESQMLAQLEKEIDQIST